MSHTSRSTLGQAANYFLNHRQGLTLFLTDLDIPISNAPAERGVRSPAVGRKTWLGTHSERGAGTDAILFSIVESCIFNKIKPREYTKNLVQDLFVKKKSYSLKEFGDLCKNNAKP